MLHVERWLPLMLLCGVAHAGLLDSLRPQAQDEFLPAEQAFALSAVATGPDRIEARWAIAPDYYLYRHQLQFRLIDTDGLTIEQITLPVGQPKTDEHFGKVEVYYDTLTAQLGLPNAAPDRELTLEVRYQGCADAGLCYPPTTERLPVVMPATR